MRVVVSGAASHLAQALLPLLCAQAEIAEVIGFDVRPVQFAHAKFVFRQMDLRDPMLAAVLQGADAFVHLAYVVLRGRMAQQEMHDINVRASQRIFELAHQAGIARLVHLSSAAVYGSGENLQENAPFRPLPGFLYGQHKAELDAWLAQQLPQVVRLRPHVILGPHCQPLLLQLLHQPCYVRLPEPQPQLQCVHEDDVARAILASVLRPVSGAFNLSAPGSFSFKQVIEQRFAHSMALPYALAKAGLIAVWRLTGYGGEPVWLEGIRHPLTLDCARAQQALGWQPQYDAQSILAALP